MALVSLELELLCGALDVRGGGCVCVAGCRSMVWEVARDGLLHFLDFALGAMIVGVCSVYASEVVV